VADALTAFIEDIEWYGETEVSLARLKRYRDALTALRGDQPDANDLGRGVGS
jgi:hypothetical protein